MLLQGFLSLVWSRLQNTYDGFKDIMDPRTDWAAKVKMTKYLEINGRCNDNDTFEFLNSHEVFS